MSQDQKIDPKKTEEIKKDPDAKEGYFHFKHKVDNVDFIFYMKDVKNVSWVHAFEGAFDLAAMFKNQIYQAQQKKAQGEAAKAKAKAQEAEKKTEKSEEPKEAEAKVA